MDPARVVAELDAIADAVARLRASLTPISGSGGGALSASLQATGAVTDPGTSVVPTMVHEQLNLSRVVAVDSWHTSSRYERFQRHVRLSGPIATLRAIATDFAVGGKRIPLGAARYTLHVDGVEVAATDVPPGAMDVSFQVDLQALPEGYRKLRIGGLADGETTPTWFVYVDKGGPRPATIPICTGSYDVTHNGSGVHSWAWVPAARTVPPRPLSPRPYAKPDLRLERRESAGTVWWQYVGALATQMLVPGNNANVFRPSRTRHDVPTTFGNQSYTWADFIDRYPRQHLLDGPRGIGTLGMVTHISVGNGRREDKPDSPLMGNIYCTDPWRLVRVSPDGTIKTLVGWRHRDGVPSHWQDPQPSHRLELVGDWSAVPEARRGCHELWGMAWDVPSLTVDPNAPPDPAEDNRRPHIGNPVCYLADSQWDRVLRCEFDGKSHATPAKVSEWVTGLADPWDVVMWRDEIIVSERQAHRVVAYRRDGTVSRVIAERNPALPGTATVNRNRIVTRVGSLAELQAQPVVAPEGLYVLDDWLYVGSYAQGLVQRFHLVTGERQPVCQPVIDLNSRYVKIAVDDGSFAERGVVFPDTWSNGMNARADYVCYMPDGRRANLPTSSSVSIGAYGTAVAVGYGRLYLGTSEEGVKVISARQASDPPLSPATSRGASEYVRRNLHLLHGPHGYGHWGWPLPWGMSADIDAYLVAMGHTKPQGVPA